MSAGLSGMIMHVEVIYDTMKDTKTSAGVKLQVEMSWQEHRNPTQRKLLTSVQALSDLMSRWGTIKCKHEWDSNLWFCNLYKWWIPAWANNIFTSWQWWSCLWAKHHDIWGMIGLLSQQARPTLHLADILKQLLRFLSTVMLYDSHVVDYSFNCLLLYIINTWYYSIFGMTVESQYSTRLIIM